MGITRRPTTAAKPPIITEAWLRERVRRPERGVRIELPPGARLSPAAADFLRDWQVEVAEPGPGVLDLGSDAGPSTPAWDRPGSFPVVLEGPRPRCELCASEVTDKPGHLTQLDAGHYAAKTHPRIALRGKLDTVHAMALLAAARAREGGEVALAGHLATVAAYVREIQSAEYAGRSVEPFALAGFDEAGLHAATHDPMGRVGIDHVVPDERDGEVLHWLSWLRCEAREAEIAALGIPAGPAASATAAGSVTHALNRLSSGVYLLALLRQAGRLEGGAP